MEQAYEYAFKALGAPSLNPVECRRREKREKEEGERELWEYVERSRRRAEEEAKRMEIEWREEVERERKRVAGVEKERGFGNARVGLSRCPHGVVVPIGRGIFHQNATEEMETTEGSGKRKRDETGEGSEDIGGYPSEK